VPRAVVAALATREVATAERATVVESPADAADIEGLHLTAAERKGAEEVNRNSKEYLASLSLGGGAKRPLRAHGVKQMSILSAPMAVVTVLFFAIHLSAYMVLQNARHPLGALFGTARMRAVVHELRYAADEYAVSGGASPSATPGPTAAPGQAAFPADLRQALTDKISEVTTLWRALMVGSSNPPGGVGGGIPLQGLLAHDPQVAAIVQERTCHSHPGTAVESACLNPSSPYLSTTTNGLDLLVGYYVNAATNLSQAAPYSLTADPSTAVGAQNASLQLIWGVQGDVEGGLLQMRDALQAELGSAITLVIGLEAIMFVAVALSFGSLLPLIKPYIRMSKEEIGRAADLLAQLPPALPVEEFVTREMGLSRKDGGPRTVGEVLSAALLHFLVGKRAELMLELEARQKKAEREAKERAKGLVEMDLQ